MNELNVPGHTHELSPGDFAAFYEDIYDRPAFQWQRDLASEVMSLGWHDYIELPTASGKSAAIDIAVFALAATADRNYSGPTFGRRIYFAVDRRLVVNQVYRHAKDVLASKLRNAARKTTEDSVVRRVAENLLSLGASEQLKTKFGQQPPLDVWELRGGLYRNDAWVRSPVQPTIIATTVDQIGSRMLFRGYGVSDRNLPIHAAMTACDSLVILDEAHCSRPFAQTVRSVIHYRGDAWANQPIKSPLKMVQMTATPAKKDAQRRIFQLTNSHYEADALLRKRHEASKSVSLLRLEKAKGASAGKKVAAELVKQAIALAEGDHRRIAIIANRVAIAKQAFDLLQQKEQNAELLIGRMRPIDREELTDRLVTEFNSNGPPKDDTTPPKFLVSTQTIEVGVDFDFDAMVTQCASLDALTQRFGRLNRIGNSPHARGIVIVAEADLSPIEKLADEKPLDPIYSNSIPYTWEHLQKFASDDGIVEFGVRASGSILDPKRVADTRCYVRGLHAPALMPAHVDMLVQTSPRPSPDPDVATFLHGIDPTGERKPQKMIQVCWRADLVIPQVEEIERNIDHAFSKVAGHWIRALELCPPTVSECMTIPLRHFQRWLLGIDLEDVSGEVEGELEEENTDLAVKPSSRDSSRYGLLWRGPDKSLNNQRSDNVGRSQLVSHRNVYGIAENETVVLPAEFGGWQCLGHVPNGPKDPGYTPLTTKTKQWQGIVHLIKSAEDKCEESISRFDEFPRVDVAEKSYRTSQARFLLRLHPKLPLSDHEKMLKKLLEEHCVVGDQIDLSPAKCHQQLKVVLDSLDDLMASKNSGTDLTLRHKLNSLLDSKLIAKYQGGFIWKTKVEPDLIQSSVPPLSSTSFDDQLDSRSADNAVSLQQHLADVAHIGQVFTRSLQLESRQTASIIQACRWHDVGKADSRFQAHLRGQTVAASRFATTLVAKSSHFGNPKTSPLPKNFRHESLSLQVIDFSRIADGADAELIRHLVTTHHGFGRPLVPVCVDPDMREVDFGPLGGPFWDTESRRSTIAPHALDSGVPDRFWQQNREFGAWGQAYLESLLRLSDWHASANPYQTNELTLLDWKPPNQAQPNTESRLIFNGIDGGNPLGFLSAIGLFRTLDGATNGNRLRFCWEINAGSWRPVVVDPRGDDWQRDELINLLLDHLTQDPGTHPSLLESPSKHEQRLKWFRDMALQSAIDNRETADWISCTQSDAAPPSAISQLQTSRRDYQSLNIRGVIEETFASHLERTLFQAWDYSDPIAGVSLHLEPREDRRHAYQWHMPSGDPTRKVSGGMIGANRLALEAWPMFQSLPARDRLTTVGFQGQRVKSTSFNWPIWSTPVGLDSVRTILALSAVVSKHTELHDLKQRGIEQLFQSSKILVGKTPNLTAASTIS
ncbi:MAG: type I-U CRISPR-associated helicase/endonuclease Cas3 [Phycisphaera sp. RhM]|nr:type I-U CRISPR-associated helicase/endonuclease Cas3 [Phycisphaera sp. RhM]